MGQHQVKQDHDGQAQHGRARVGGQVDLIPAQEAEAAQQAQLAGGDPALALDHDVLPLHDDHGLHVVPGLLSGLFGFRLVEDHVGFDALPKHRQGHVLHQSGIKLGAHGAGDSADDLFQLLAGKMGVHPKVGHRVHGFAEGVKILLAGVHQGAELVLVHHHDGQKGGGVLKLFPGIVIALLFFQGPAELPDGGQLGINLVQLGHDPGFDLVAVDGDRLHPVGRFGAPGFGGDLVHHVLGRGDRHVRHLAQKQTVLFRDQADDEQRGHQNGQHRVQKAALGAGAAKQPAPFFCFSGNGGSSLRVAHFVQLLCRAASYFW